MTGYSLVVGRTPGGNKQRKAGLSLVTLLLLGAVLTTSMMTLAVDYTRQFNVARQAEATYQDQYAIQGAIQQVTAEVLNALKAGEDYPQTSRDVTIRGRTVRVTITRPDGDFKFEASILP